MSTRTHLFLAAPAAAFGEVSTGVRIALDLVARGERVVFLAPGDTEVLLRGTPIVHVPVDADVFSLERLVKKVLRREGASSLTLIDVTSVYLALDPVGIDLDFLEKLDVPVVALDFWDLRATGLEWDFGADVSPVPPAALSFERRLFPVPVARPDRGRGAFRNLPLVTPRGDFRSELGLGPDDRLLLWTTSRWQLPEMQAWKHHQRVAEQVPALLSSLLARLGPRVHVLHLGPRALEAWDAWGERYHFQAPVPGERLEEILGAVDLVVSLNVAATTSIYAIAAGVPVVAVVNSREGTAGDVAASLNPSAELAAWLEQAAPLHRFRLWPLGLHRFLAPTSGDNPFASAFDLVELLEEDALVDRCRRLLDDPEVRGEALRRQGRYREAVAALPSAADAFLDWL